MNASRNDRDADSSRAPDNAHTRWGAGTGAIHNLESPTGPGYNASPADTASPAIQKNLNRADESENSETHGGDFRLNRKVNAMLKWALIFLVIALIAGVAGMSGLSGMAQTIAWILLVVFLILFVVSLVMGRRPSV